MATKSFRFWLNKLLRTEQFNANEFNEFCAKVDTLDSKGYTLPLLISFYMKKEKMCL